MARSRRSGDRSDPWRMVAIRPTTSIRNAPNDACAQAFATKLGACRWLPCETGSRSIGDR